MAKQTYYAVKEGHKIGVFEDWADCLEATKGFPNAKYKKFLSKDEASAYLKDKDIYLEKIKEDIENGFIVAFSDGSFDKNLKKYSFGAIIFDKNLTKSEIYGAFKNEKYLSSNNVAGEVFAIINVLDWAVSHHYTKVKIYYDYEGVEKWSNGEWSAKTEIAKLLYFIVNEKYKDLVTIEFEHVKGHSNNKYNEEADRLAKMALKTANRSSKQGDNWFKAIGFRSNDINTLVEVLKEDYPDIKVEMRQLDGRELFKLCINREHLNVTSYANGTLLVQGKMSTLFQMFTTYLCELIKDEQVIPVMKDAYGLNIKKEEVDGIFLDLFKEIPSDYPPSMNKLLKQSIINMTTYIKSEDYSQYVFPVYRSLEGHLKYKLEKCGIHVSKTFNMFNKNQSSGLYCLTDKGTASMDQISDIETCYNLWKRHRDTVFHFGEIIGSVDNTRLIGTYEEAKQLISESLALIQETL